MKETKSIALSLCAAGLFAVALPGQTVKILWAVVTVVVMKPLAAWCGRS